ncbi:MAG: hypothetical protein AAB250_19305, partial [Bdellovibrionota bacterium]
LLLSEPRLKAQIQRYETLPLKKIGGIADPDVRDLVTRWPGVRANLKSEVAKSFDFSHSTPTNDEWVIKVIEMTELGFSQDLIHAFLNEVIVERLKTMPLSELRKSLVKAVKVGNKILMASGLVEIAVRTGNGAYADLQTKRPGSEIGFDFVQALFFVESFLLESKNISTARPILTIEMLRELLPSHPELLRHLFRNPTYAGDPAAVRLFESLVAKEGTEFAMAMAFTYPRTNTWDWVMKALTPHLLAMDEWKLSSTEPYQAAVSRLASFLYVAANAAPPTERDLLVRKTYLLARKLKDDKRIYYSNWVDLIGGLLISKGLESLDIRDMVIADAMEIAKSDRGWSNSTMRSLEGEFVYEIHGDRFKALAVKARKRIAPKGTTTPLGAVFGKFARSKLSCESVFAR